MPPLERFCSKKFAIPSESVFKPFSNSMVKVSTEALLNVAFETCLLFNDSVIKNQLFHLNITFKPFLYPMAKVPLDALFNVTLKACLLCHDLSQKILLFYSVR